MTYPDRKHEVSFPPHLFFSFLRQFAIVSKSITQLTHTFYPRRHHAHYVAVSTDPSSLSEMSLGRAYVVNSSRIASHSNPYWAKVRGSIEGRVCFVVQEKYPMPLAMKCNGWGQFSGRNELDCISSPSF